MAVETVSVGCKLPHGLVCRIGQADPTGEAGSVRDLFTLKGCSFCPGQDAPPTLGAAYTTVPKEDWEAWKATGHPAIKAGHVFASPKMESVQAEAKEKLGLKTGFEGIDPVHPDPKLSPAPIMRKAGIQVPEGA